jgi:two-component system, NtrC family, nitrogen regulation response regulator NtrX
MPDALAVATARVTGASTSAATSITGALELVGHSPAITRVRELVRRAAPLDTAILLTAEQGTDADSVARELHKRSRRAGAPYVRVECDGADAAGVGHALFGRTPGPRLRPLAGSAAAPPDLESISLDGAIAAARGGTLFLQNLTELPAAVQARLARIVRDGEACLDGEAVSTDIRFVASASPSVEADAHAHRLRSDLFRRIAGVRIDLPPLRERQDDVPLIAGLVLGELLTAQGRRPRAFTQAALALIAAVTWPGNLDELREAVARVVANPGDHDIQVEHLLPALDLQRAPARFAPTGNLREARLKFEREYISAVLQHHAWRVADAAHTLGIQRPNLYRKARQLGIPVTRVSD